MGGGYGFLFHSEFFFRTTRELEYLFFLSRKARNFFKNFNIRLYDKNSEAHYFFFLHQNQNIFLEKKTYPPSLQVKWSFPYSEDINTLLNGILTIAWRKYAKIWRKLVLTVDYWFTIMSYDDLMYYLIFKWWLRTEAPVVLLLLPNPIKSHERARKDRIVITTNGPYP